MENIQNNTSQNNIHGVHPIKLGLVGKSLSHSLSPRIHSYILDKLGILGTYEKVEVSENEVSGIIPMMMEKNILGLNVTIPYKETLFRLVDECDSHAKNIGAINTIKIKNGVSYGYNTDYLGVIHMFRNANVSLQGKDIVILGSGGSTKALIYAFNLEGANKITVSARNLNSSQELKLQFPFIEIQDLSGLIEKASKGDIIVNTTPVGMFPKIDESPVPESTLANFKVAGDIVYNPLVTKFLTLAKKQNLKIVTGLSMLVNQAIASEEIWLEQKIDYEMSGEIENFLTEKDYPL